MKAWLETHVFHAICLAPPGLVSPDEVHAMRAQLEGDEAGRGEDGTKGQIAQREARARDTPRPPSGQRRPGPTQCNMPQADGEDGRRDAEEDHHARPSLEDQVERGGDGLERGLQRHDIAEHEEREAKRQDEGEHQAGQRQGRSRIPTSSITRSHTR
jgi:hypothetical protein